MIELINVSYKYKLRDGEEIQALNGINLTFSEKEFVAIVGPNGSGKSTLAKLLNGLLLPTSGKVLVDGLDTSKSTDAYLVRKKVGMVFQNPDNQIIATKVEEDVAFGPENLGLPPDEIRKRVYEALALVNMEKFASFEPHLLSQGEKQRVAIAGVLAMKPKYVVLDEPTSQLDPRGRKKILEIMKKLNREEGIGVIYITHFLKEAAAFDRLVALYHGEIAYDGVPRNLLADLEKLHNLGLSPLPATVLAAMLKREGVAVSQDILFAEELVEALCCLS